jgi:hypothetical protein
MNVLVAVLECQLWCSRRRTKDEQRDTNITTETRVRFPVFHKTKPLRRWNFNLLDIDAVWFL